MFRNMAVSLIRTVREDEDAPNAARVPGRVVTTVPKAKELRPFVERLVTIAKKAQPHLEAASQYATDAARNSSEWKQWRESELTAQQAANRLRISRKEACDASRDFLRASDLNDRKLKSIDRAFKRGLSGHKMLNKLWDADAALRMADRKRLHYKCKWAEAGWDAQIAINEAQSKRFRRLKRIIHSAKKSELQKVGS